MTADLRVVVGGLPVSWDGDPVKWSEWSDGRTTLPLHVPADALVCAKCGAVDESLHAFGTRPPPEGAVFTGEEVRTTKSGHEYTVNVAVPAWPVRDLWAARCRHCGHDVVTDQRTGEAWDLDPSDYGPDGSNWEISDEGLLF